MSRIRRGCLPVSVLLLFRLLAGRQVVRWLIAVCRGVLLARRRAAIQLTVAKLAACALRMWRTALHRLARNCTGPRASTGSSNLFIVGRSYGGRWPYRVAVQCLPSLANEFFAPPRAFLPTLEQFSRESVVALLWCQHQRSGIQENISSSFAVDFHQVDTERFRTPGQVRSVDSRNCLSGDLR